MQKEIIKKSYENLLISTIKKLNSKISSPEEIWDNLDALATKVNVFDKEISYLPLNMKKILAYIVDPDYRIEYKSKVTDDACEVEALFYWSNQDKPCGVGFVKRHKSQINKFNELTSDERDSQLEATVRGLAASRAITDAGIGIQFYCDSLDLAISTQEEDELKGTEQNNKQTEVPRIPSAVEKKEARARKKAEVNAIAEKEAANKTPSESVQEQMIEATDSSISDSSDNIANQESEQVSNVTESINETEDASHSISLEEAKTLKATKGTYAGNPLGLIYEACPNNIIWLSKFDPDQTVMNAAKVIAMSDDYLRSKLG